MEKKLSENKAYSFPGNKTGVENVFLGISFWKYIQRYRQENRLQIFSNFSINIFFFFFPTQILDEPLDVLFHS